MEQEIMKDYHKVAYEQAISFINKGERCAIIMPTGTGKSIIISKLLQDYDNIKKIVITPRKHINESFKEHNINLNQDNIVYVTYQKLLSDYKDNKLKDYTDFKFIAADEIHHAGATMWKEAFECLINKNKDSIVIGATATPKRYDQETEDMVQLLFDGNRCSDMFLADAIKKGILEMPTYVAALFSLKENEKWKKLYEKLDKLEATNLEKIMFTKELKGREIDFENSASIKVVFKRFLTEKIDKNNNSLKILIFCKNINHLNDNKEKLNKIFEEVFPNMKIKTGVFHSKSKDNDFINFNKEKLTDTIQVLYVVDKLNEGIHISDLGAVILLRETQSLIVYLQQIGRVLSINGQKDPLIIDLVNNCYNVENYKIWKECEEYFNSKEDKISGEKKDKPKKVYMYNYIEDVLELFEKMSARLEQYHDPKKYEYRGEFATTQEHCKKYGQCYKTVCLRMNRTKNPLPFKEAMDCDIMTVNIKGKEVTDYLNVLCIKAGKQNQYKKFLTLWEAGENINEYFK